MFNAEQARELAFKAHSSEVATTLQHLENLIKEVAESGLYSCVYVSPTKISVTTIKAISTELEREGYHVFTWFKGGIPRVQVDW